MYVALLLCLRKFGTARPEKGSPDQEKRCICPRSLGALEILVRKHFCPELFSQVFSSLYDSYMLGLALLIAAAILEAICHMKPSSPQSPVISLWLVPHSLSSIGVNRGLHLSVTASATSEHYGVYN